MPVLVINKSHVQKLLSMKDCIKTIANSFRSLAIGEVVMPRRLIMWLPKKVGALGLMPAYCGEPRVLGVKVITAFPCNQNTEFHTHQGMVVLFGADHGEPLAIIDASEITAIRTAAVSGVATDLLSNPNAGDLLIMGSGVQAAKHLEAMLLVREIRRIRVWNPFPGLAKKFSQIQSERLSISIEPLEGREPEIDGADIICTVTGSTEPVLLGKMISPGTHVNAVGASFPHARELDTEAVVKSRFFVDLRDSALNEAGDFLFPKNEGVIDDKHILGEIGEVLLGKVEGRRSREDITVFKSLGLAVEDVTAAKYVFDRAYEEGAGQSVEI